MHTKGVIASVKEVNLKELIHFLLYAFTTLFVVGSELSNSQRESKEKEEGRKDFGKVKDEDAKWAVPGPGLVTGSISVKTQEDM